MKSTSVTDDSPYTVTFTVTDSLGRSQSDACAYIIGITENTQPVINSAIYTEETRTLVVTVSDNDDYDYDSLYIYLTIPEGLTVDASGKYASQTGPLTASFVWQAEDNTAGASGQTWVTVIDSAGATDSTYVDITIPLFASADDAI